MAILDKLMEKKDLDAYINLRLEFIDSVMHKEVNKLPEKERELVRQRFVGRKVELKKLLRLLKEDKIKDMSKTYFQKINTESDDGDGESSKDEGDKIS
jgi:hypothetical protein